MRTYLLALAIGLAVGALGSAFHYCLNVTSDLFTKTASLFADDGPSVVIFAALSSAAMVGLAFVLVRRFAPEAAGSGIQEIEGAMAGLRPVRWRRVIPVKFVGGVLAMGSGLVLGREGPTIHLGGCISALIGEKTQSDTDTMNTLLAAGAAAGLSVAFSAPLGAILFVTEEMRRRFNYTFVSLHAVILASITAKLVNDRVFGMQPELPVQLQLWLPQLPSPEEILYFLPLYLMLGGVIGIFGAGFNTVMLGCLRFSDRLGRRTMLIIASSVGAVAGALMVIAPEFVGGGEALVKQLFSASPTLGFLLAILLVRAVMTFLSYSVGVPGGIFAPMLALGTVAGLSFGYVAQDIFPNLELHTGAFAIAAMGALFAATVRAPLTGIVLVAEMTASFELLPALIVTCMTASITAQSLGSKPIYDLLLTRTLDNARTTA
jgi:CIC family chloride channel protein